MTVQCRLEERYSTLPPAALIRNWFFAREHDCLRMLRQSQTVTTSWARFSTPARKLHKFVKSRVRRN